MTLNKPEEATVEILGVDVPWDQYRQLIIVTQAICLERDDLAMINLLAIAEGAQTRFFGANARVLESEAVRLKLLKKDRFGGLIPTDNFARVVINDSVRCINGRCEIVRRYPEKLAKE